VNSAEYITNLIAGKVVDLAVLGAVLKAFLAVASRLSLAAVKAPSAPKADRETRTEAPAVPEADATAPIVTVRPAA
jgi:hypothetical protein